MDKNIQKVNSLLKSSTRAIICVLPLIVMIIFRLLKISCNVKAVQSLMMLGFAVTLGIGFIWAYKKKLTEERILILIIAAGVILRIGYMGYTNWDSRGHDVGTANGTGHAGYIVNNILNGHLPSSTDNQFYHPPLYHMLAALLIKIVAVIKNTKDYASLLNYASVVSCMAMCAVLPMVQKIMDEVKISRKYQSIGMAAAAFYPNFMFMGGRVNNDALVTFFIIAAVYFTIRWYYSESMKDIVGIALSIGLGMMTKVSCGAIAVFTGPIMLYKLYIGLKNKKLLPIIKQLAVFAVICFPLALWFPTRNYILFGQGLNHMTKPTGTDLYNGDESIASRFILFPILQEFKQVYSLVYDDYNVFMIMMRTSLFGEWGFNVSKIISVSLFYFAGFLGIISIIGMAVSFVKAKNRFRDISLIAVWIIISLSFVTLNITLPYFCSANARYIAPAAVIGMIYTAKLCDICEESGRKKARISLYIIEISTAVYCTLVAIMYSVC